MTDKQIQKTATGAVAIQASGDVNYSGGISPGQMIEIIDAISRQVQAFSAEAQNRLEDRLREFKESVIDKIATETPESAASFADPDFQHALMQAQTSYGRSDDEDLHQVLVDLVVQRSKQAKRNRLTLTLNDAIVTAASLTQEEFSILAFMFAMQDVKNIGVGDMRGVATHLSSLLNPLVDQIPDAPVAYSYLEAHGCVSGTSGFVLGPSAMEIIKNNYPEMVTRGLPSEELRSLISVSDTVKFDELLRESSFDPSLKILVPGNPYSLNQLQNNLAIAAPFTDAYTAGAKANLPDDADLIAKLEGLEPSLRRATELYDKTPMRAARLTPVGMALGHAHLTKTAQLTADLSIWIQ